MAASLPFCMWKAEHKDQIAIIVIIIIIITRHWPC
jgi:hypothetical protein